MSDRLSRLHPEAQAFLKAAARAARDAPKLWDVAPQTARANAALRADAWNDEIIAGVTTFERHVHSAGREIAVRHYRPDGRSDRNGAIIYAHGGGWVVGDLDFEDLKLRKLSLWSGLDVVSVDYRLAPEHPCPAGRDDIVAVFAHVLRCADTLDLDPRRLGFSGASAGANLALSAALAAREANLVPAAIALFYGVYDLRYRQPSFETNATGFGLETRAMEHFRTLYVGDDPKAWTPPDASPGLADLDGLPPVFINAVETDPLYDDSLALAARLKASGVEVTTDLHENTIHGFTAMSAIMPHANGAIRRAAEWLSARLSGE